MTDAPVDPAAVRAARAGALQKGLKRRYAREARFRAYGLLAIAVALGFLCLLLGRIIEQGHTAFYSNEITVPVYMDPARIDRDYPQGTNFQLMVAQQQLARMGITDDALGTQANAYRTLLSSELKFRAAALVRENPSVIGQTVEITAPVSDDADLYLKGKIKRSEPAELRRISDQQMAWLDDLQSEGTIRAGFNSLLFTQGDSTEPELAGVLGAVVGSALMLLVTALIAIPLGVGAAVYLEEFAPRGRFTDLIEVNINNLAAVPSIVFGLLGLAMFISFFGLPRSAPLVGGLVLTLLTLPTIIIASRAALKAVPPSIREAALGIGASRWQTVVHHVLPLAMPGVLTGAIIGMARALGESAPLLMIGMVAFIVEVPAGVLDPSTVLPVQVFLWSDLPERGFVERTSGAIIVLLLFLIVMNAAAVVLRSKFEKRW